MVDVTATVIRFAQFAFEYGPFLLAAWLMLGVTTGLIGSSRKGALACGYRRVPRSPGCAGVSCTSCGTPA